MELSIKTLDSRTHVFKDVDPEITVENFKDLAAPVVALSIAEQRLIFRGRVLQNDKKLKDYNVTSGQVLHLVGRNPASATPSNDQPSATNTPNGGVQNRTTITMGGGGQGPPQRTAASARIQVAHDNMNRASTLLQTLEQEMNLRLPEEPADPDEDSDDEFGGIGHQAAAAAVVASFRQVLPGSGGAGSGGSGNDDMFSDSGIGNSGTATVIQLGLGNGSTGTSNNNASPGSTTATSGEGTARRGRRHSRHTETPMLRELSTALNDVIALNERLTPHLRTVERWLRNNPDFANNTTSVQYTYNTVSSILHSISHSLHALSDITVDFSQAPASRRLRAPTSVLVEQSTVFRATIPVGMHLDLGGSGDLGGPQVLGVNLDASAQPQGPGTGAAGRGTGGGPQGGIGQGQGSQTRTGAAGLQQALANLFQGAMFQGAMNINQQLGQARTPPVATVAPTPAETTAAGQQQQPAANNATGTPGAGQQLSSNIGAGTLPQLRAAGAAGTTEARPAAAPNTAQQQALQSLLAPLQGHPHRRRDILLNCHSQHFNREPPTPARPDGLVQFLSQQMGDTTQASHNLDREYFEMLLGFCQILNSAHPVMIHYIQGNLLRGRDVNNPNHVQTGVRSYGRRFAEWIVGALPGLNEENTASLNTSLADVTTRFLAQVIQVILRTTAGNPITTPLNSLIIEWLPQFVDVFRNAFQGQDYKQVLHGVVYLIVDALFSDTPLTFRTRLTATLVQYICSIVPLHETEESIADEPESAMNPAEIQVGIDMEIEVGTPEIVESESSTPIIPGSSENRSPAVERIDDPVANDTESDGDDVMTEYQAVRHELLQHLPSSWHNTVLTDIERQDALRNGNQQQPPFSPGFLSLFPQK